MNNEDSKKEWINAKTLVKNELGTMVRFGCFDFDQFEIELMDNTEFRRSMMLFLTELREYYPFYRIIGTLPNLSE